jgi:hypothetical protein
MANVALAAPTLTLGGMTPALGLIGAGTAVNGSTSLTIAGNNGLLLLNFITAAVTTSTSVTVVAPNSANNVTIGTLAVSSNYWLGPFDPAVFTWPVGASAQSGVAVAGLVYITGSFGAVANTAQVFYLPAGKPLASYCSLHDAFYGGTAGLADC